MSYHQQSVIVGNERFRYQVLDGWAQLPAGWSFVEVVGVATDSRDRVFAFNRGEHPLIVFDRDGRFLQSWGEGVFVRPHGIHIGPDDEVYLTDDRGHTIRKFTTDGRLLTMLEPHGVGSDTGVTNDDYRTIKRAAGPFNIPTNLALAPDGCLYISDGYGNARVHKFSPDGRLLLSWGEPGDGKGQFHLPHGIAVDRDGRVYVADRENSRVQIFDAAGRFLTAWRDVGRPSEVFIDGNQHVYVSEFGFRCGMFSGTVAPPNPAGSRVSIFDRQGKLLCRWGGGPDPCAAGDFFAAHDIWVDSRGDLYVSEVTMSAGGRRGLVSPTCHTLQKFVRR